MPAGDQKRFWEIKAPGTNCAGSGKERVPSQGDRGRPGGNEPSRGTGRPKGTMASRGNEGVGEHVRTRFHSGLLAPVKLRIVKDTRTERRKACFFCRTGFGKANSPESRSSRLT